jgi:hypothetical protein
MSRKTESLKRCSASLTSSQPVERIYTDCRSWWARGNRFKGADNGFASALMGDAEMGTDAPRPTLRRAGRRRLRTFDQLVLFKTFKAMVATRERQKPAAPPRRSNTRLKQRRHVAADSLTPWPAAIATSSSSTRHHLPGSISYRIWSPGLMMTMERNLLLSTFRLKASRPQWPILCHSIWLVLSLRSRGLSHTAQPRTGKIPPACSRLGFVRAKNVEYQKSVPRIIPKMFHGEQKETLADQETRFRQPPEKSARR